MNLRNTIFSIVLLGLVLAGALSAQGYTRQVCDRTIATLEQASQCTKNGESAKSVQLIAEAIDEFGSSTRIFAWIHHHSYCENILTYLQRALVYADAGFLPEMDSELHTAICALDAFRNRDALSAGNLF